MASRAQRLGMAATIGLVFGLGTFGACSRNTTYGPPQNSTGGSSGQGGQGGDPLPQDDGGPPPLDADGLCGNQLHTVIFDAPNVYFVIDASGSMSLLAKGGSSRYSLVRGAAIDLVKALGPLINVGAAVFPLDATEADPCATGAQVMDVNPGDPYTGADGPTTKKFKAALKRTPNGGTPTAATLEELLPQIGELPGKTLVLLVTDGGPNCNASLTCDGAHCGLNVDDCTGLACCAPGGNCCDQPGGATACIDADATVSAVSGFASAQIPLYVIGIPGSGAFADVLQQMAFAAGTAQLAQPYYYAVDDIDNLQSVLGGIAAVAVSCVFQIDDPPSADNETNVYLDGVVLPNGGDNGWRWMDPDLTRIELLGESCARLKAGQIKTVQIVSGCPTEPSK